MHLCQVIFSGMFSVNINIGVTVASAQTVEATAIECKFHLIHKSE